MLLKDFLHLYLLVAMFDHSKGTLHVESLLGLVSFLLDSV